MADRMDPENKRIGKMMAALISLPTGEAPAAPGIKHSAQDKARHEPRHK
jgi:hypothetical protein